MKKVVKGILKGLLILLALLVLIVGGYFVYLLVAYHRLPDKMALDVTGNRTETVSAGTEYKILSYNVGFGAYEADYDFFMDGGTQSWAPSKEGLLANMDRITGLIKAENADFILIQEVDFDSTRSYHVDESAILAEALPGYGSTRAENWDSPFLLYPFTQPHGASRSAIMTFSSAKVTEAERVSLPVETSLYKLLDLDRCYAVHRIPAENGKELVLVNLHLSAYTSDGTISDEQVRLLAEFMQAEYEKGNYVIAGGDFNKDLTGDPERDFGTLPKEDYSWAKPFPSSYLAGKNLSLKAPYDPETKVASCRNPDAAWTYDNATQFVITVDGFIVSDNVEVKTLEVIDTQYAYSDHNPVRMTFELK